MQERLSPRVEDARTLLGDARPRPHAGEHVGQVVEQLRRAVHFAHERGVLRRGDPHMERQVKSTYRRVMIPVVVQA